MALLEACLVCSTIAFAYNDGVFSVVRVTAWVVLTRSEGTQGDPGFEKESKGGQQENHGATVQSPGGGLI